jgi:hypothetical protein
MRPSRYFSPNANNISARADESYVVSERAFDWQTSLVLDGNILQEDLECFSRLV